MADEQKEEEEEQKIDIFAYEEMNITQDSVSGNQYLTKQWGWKQINRK